MNPARWWRRRWRERRRLDREMDEEIAHHVAARAEEYERAGMDPVEARARAMQQFGNADAARRSYRRLVRSTRDGRGGSLPSRELVRWMGAGIADLRLGWRTVLRHPRQHVTSILVLALGIGLSAVALSLLRVTLLAPYPFPAADELHTLWATQPELNRTQVSMSLAEVDDYAEAGPTVGEIGVIRGLEAGLSSEGSGNGGAVMMGFVNSAYFRVLGMAPALGRTFVPEEDVGVGAHPVAVISHRFWRTHLADRDDPIGAEIVISATRFTVVGVMPENFWGPETVAVAVDVWVPVTMSPPFLGGAIYTNRAERIFWTVFRAASPAVLDRIRSEFEPVRERLAREFPTDHDGWSFRTMPLREFVDGTSRREAVRLVVTAAILILLVSSINVASLRFIAAQQRLGEAAIRLALGGTRSALVRRYVAESLVLAAVAGGLGLILAQGAIAALQGNVALPLPTHATLNLDPAAVMVAAVLMLGIGVCVGVLPALFAVDGRSATGLRPTARVHGTSGGVGRTVRRAIVMAEVAGTVVLLQASLATIQALRDVVRTPLGFQSSGLLTMRVDLQDGRAAPADSAARRAYSRARWERRWQFAERLTAEAAALPGVDEAAVWAPSMLGASGWHARLIHGDLDPNDAKNIVTAQRHSITPGALELAGVPIVMGRDLNDADGTDSIPGVVVDQRLAAYFWPGQDPVGQVFYTFGGVGQARVVGVSARARHRGRLRSEDDIIGDLFFPYRFWPTTTASVIARGPGDVRVQLDGLRDLVARIDPTIGIYDVSPMDDRVRRAEGIVRLPAVVMSVFGTIAVVLAVTGILAVVHHTLQSREREIGLQRALGLDGMPLLVALLSDTARPVVAGAALGGVAGALVGSRVISATTVGGAAVATGWGIALVAFLGTITVGLAAGLVPVRRSARTSPAELLRES